MKTRKSFLTFTGAAVLVLTAWLPSTALASTGDDIPPADDSASGAVWAPMTIDCETFSETDRARAIEENLNLCGALSGESGGIAARGQAIGDCGVSSIYVDRNSGGRLRISYGMHSTVGAIIGRALTATWGPFNAGSNPDIGAVGQESYSNTLTGASVPRNARAGGTLRGTVAIAGWTFSCTIVADDPVHNIFP